jgi:transposase/regulator of replication initiation timing
MKTIVSDIEEVVKAVVFRNRELQEKISALEVLKVSLEAEKVILEAENAALRSRLSQLEAPKKDSHNSSIPPGAESLKEKSIRRTRSLRKPSGRPSGGQVGHKGSTLLMSDHPDVTQTYSSDYCPSCGASLAGIEGKVAETRQCIDIPLPVCPIITNHVSMSKICTCGKCTRGSFPDEINPGVSYGANLHAVVAYLNVVQDIPFKRLTDTIRDLYGLEMSQGSISNILNRMRKQSKPAYEIIRERIAQSPVIGADETGEQLNGKLHWMWVFQNTLLTYIFQHSSRGKAAIDEHFAKGLTQSILVTDRHAAYFNMETSNHQLCLAHLLRELIYLGELDTEQKWSFDMLDLLHESIHERKSVPLTEINIGSIKERLRILLEQDLSMLDKKFASLQKSLNKHKEHLFLFLEYSQVPYDNNASERVCRPLKVKQKVSGMFKSEQGADAFCQLYSIADTARKNKQDPFMAFLQVAKFRTGGGE